jgi:hypothetical protein
MAGTATVAAFAGAGIIVLITGRNKNHTGQ